MERSRNDRQRNEVSSERSMHHMAPSIRFRYIEKWIKSQITFAMQKA